MSIDFNRVKYCIWGQVIGDAVGVGTEFMTIQQVKNHYNNKPFTYNEIIRDEHRSTWCKGRWTDDTDQMIVMLNTITNSTKDRYSIVFAKLLTNWRQYGFIEFGDLFGGSGLGKAIAWVMNEECFLEDPKRAAKNIWDDSDYTENGCIMRQNFLGTMNKPLQEVVDISVDFCLSTHADPRCVGACVYSVVIVYHFVRGELDIEKVMKNAYEISISEMKKLNYTTDYHIEKFNSYFEEIKDISMLNLDKPQVRSTIKQTFRCVVYTLQQLKLGKSFSDIMWSIVLQGGDADTNAATCCSIMGAYFGKVSDVFIDTLTFKKEMEDKINKWIYFNNINR